MRIGFASLDIATVKLCTRVLRKIVLKCIKFQPHIVNRFRVILIRIKATKTKRYQIQSSRLCTFLRNFRLDFVFAVSNEMGFEPTPSLPLFYLVVASFCLKFLVLGSTAVHFISSILVVQKPMLWFEPGADGWEMRTLPLCHATPRTHFTELIIHQNDKKTSSNTTHRIVGQIRLMWPIDRIATIHWIILNYIHFLFDEHS